MTLKNELKTNKNLRKLFGKKEIEIMLKQLQGIKLKQSERNRLSRDIKSKLEAVADLFPHHEEFKLKKNQDNKKKMQDTVNIILKDPVKEKIKAILLFGSMLTGPITPNSDVDIAAVFDDIDLKESTKFRIRIAGRASDKVDIQVFNTLPKKIKREIAKHHQMLWTRSDFNNREFTESQLKGKASPA